MRRSTCTASHAIATMSGAWKRSTLALFCIAFVCSLTSAAIAEPITGTPVGSSFPWTPNSTNALDYAQQVPGRIGQVAPFVLFNSSSAGSVTLDFYNFASGLAFFERRIDGIETGTTAHPIVLGDTIHSGTSVASGSVITRTFLATSYVDIRLALGGERDWDFNWTRFAVGAAETVPEPDALFLLSLGGLGLAWARSRKAARRS